MEHAADKIATVVSRSSVATTQILTGIGGALEGCSIDKLSKTQARASLMDSGHGSETDAQNNSDRRGNEEIGAGEEKLQGHNELNMGGVLKVGQHGGGVGGGGTHPKP